jgi:hypothetical protein
MRSVLAVMIMMALICGGDALAAKKKLTAPPAEKTTFAPPMSVVIVRSNEAGCEPLCPQWIQAEGEITTSTPARFEKVFKAMGATKLPIVITSPGGSIEAALQIGHMIRKRKLDVYLGWTNFYVCWPNNRSCKLPPEHHGIYRGEMMTVTAFCNSACPLILAAGVNRLVDSSTAVGVHQPKTVWTQQQIFYRERFVIVKGKKKVISRTEVSRKNLKPRVTFGLGNGLRKKLAVYYRDMGVDTAILDESEKAAFKDIRVLTVAQLDQFHLRTSAINPLYVLKTGMCRGSKPAYYCVKSDVDHNPTQAATSDANWIMPPARHVPGPDMEFQVMIEAGGTCKSQCHRWIAAMGVITKETPRKLDAFLGFVKSGENPPLVISSLGGDALSAMTMGRLLRKRGMPVAVGKTALVDCNGDDQSCRLNGLPGVYRGVLVHGSCEDACVLVLAGGRTRYAEDISLHPPDTYVPSPPGLRPEGFVSGYLTEMGLSQAAIETINTRGDYGWKQVDNPSLMKAGIINSSGPFLAGK